MPPASDARHLAHAIRLARASVRAGGGPFGAVVVKGARVVGRGQNRVTLAPDPTAHAEVEAIRDACRRLGTFRLDGCVVYASCEPCPMCLAALYWARVDRVVHAARASDAARAGFDDRAILDEVRAPPRARRLRATRVPVPGTASPFEAWSRKRGRIDY